MLSKIIENMITKAANNSSGNGFNFAQDLRSRSTLTDEELTSYTFAYINSVTTYLTQIENFGVKVRNGERELLEPNHWLNELIRQPNIAFEYSWIDVIEMISYWLEYYGNAYIWIPWMKNIGRRPNRLTVMPSFGVTLKFDSTESNIVRYDWNISGKKIEIPKEEIVHIKTLFVSKDIQKSLFLGQPRILNSIKKSIAMDSKSLDLALQSLGFGGVPLMALLSEKKITTETYELVKDRSLKAFGGMQPIKFALGEGTKLEPLERGIKDALAAVAGTSTAQDALNRMSYAFGEPVPILNGDFKNKATADRILKEFKSTKIEPRMQRIDNAFSNFFGKFEDGLRLTHDPETFEDQKEINDTIKTVIPNGIMSPNEARKRFFNMDPYDGGDNYVDPSRQSIQQPTEEPVKALKKKRSI